MNESLTLQSRGPELTVRREGSMSEDDTFVSFPAAITLTLPGTYTVSQITYFNQEVKEQIFVKIPTEESNIKLQKDRLNGPIRSDNVEESYRDLLGYFAAALVALLFIEWLLKSRDNV